MAIPVKEILMVAKFLNSKEGKKLTKSITGKSQDGNDTTSNYEPFQHKTYANEDLENMSQGQKLDKIREIMAGDPTDYIVRGAAAAGTGISDFIGNKAVTDANHLAQAILAANRTNSARQNDIYGPSRKENAANVWAQEKLRRGENIKNATNEVSNVIRNLSGLYGQREDAARAMQAQQVLGAPGNFYNYLNSVQRANAAATTGKDKGGK